MKSALFLIWFGIVSAASGQSGGTPNDSLPSAPSAVIAPKPTPAPAKPQQPVGDLTPPADTSQTPPRPGSAVPAPLNPAAPNAEGELPEAETIRVKAREVNVVFTVTDRKGRYIRDLKRTDVKVLDNKQLVSDLRSFAAESNLPLRVGLLIDASSSIRERFRFEQEAAIEFLNQIVRPHQDKAFVVSFDSIANVEQEMTNDVGRLSQGVRQIRAGGGTALFDAIYFASRDVLMKNRDNTPVRRAIILLSDGDDNQSRVTREEAIEMAQRAEVILYTISTDLSNTFGKGEKVLERLADATGGRAFHPFKLEEVANAFTDIQDELRSQYAMAYRPANLIADGSYRTIDIEVPGKRYKVRARKGYFAPKQ